MNEKSLKKRKMVKKRLKKARESARKAREATRRLRKEFRKHIVIAIAAALGFLIALSWREPISNLTDHIITILGLQGEQILYQFLAAIIITIILVLALVIVTRWEIKKE